MATLCEGSKSSAAEWVRGLSCASVPKDAAAHLEFRLCVYRVASTDVDVQQELIDLCEKDILFWINTFCWLDEPRNLPLDRPTTIPFNTFSFQDPFILDVAKGLGKHDIWVPKSRTMGVTWQILAIYVHAWLFRSGARFKLGSRKEDAVDLGEDPDALMGKAEFILKHIEKYAPWMMPAGFDWRKHRTYLRLVNPQRNSRLVGESTNKHFGRSGRVASMMLDEFPAVECQAEILRATASVCRGRIFVGTYESTSDHFYEKTHDPDQYVLRLHWTQHPEYSAGLYRVRNGVVERLDPDYQYPANFQFVTSAQPFMRFRDGGHRSPWYDYECRRRKNEQEVAREIDMDPEGAMYAFFSPELVDPLLKQCLNKPPRRIPLAQVFRAPEGAEWQAFWTRCRGASIDVWVPLDAQGRPPSNRTYKIGIDIAAGTGATPSVISVGDCLTGEQAAEFAWPHIEPHELAHVAVALARWFKGQDVSGAQIIWEDKGPGATFGRKLGELGFTHVYWRRNEKSASKKTTDTPGWQPTPQNIRDVLGSFKDALADEPARYVPHSEELIKELKKFIYKANKVAHSDSEETDDPSGAGENHGDRVTAAALCWWLMRHLVINPSAETQTEPPRGGYAWGSPGWRNEYHRNRNAKRQGCLADW